MFRSLAHIYAQVIDDTKGQTLVAASSRKVGKTARQRRPQTKRAPKAKRPRKSRKDGKAAKVEEKPKKAARGEKGDAKGEKKGAEKETAASAKARGGNLAGAKLIGKMIAERAKEKGIKQVVFDRGGYLYHGRVKALADAAREAGLEF